MLWRASWTRLFRGRQRGDKETKACIKNSNFPALPPVVSTGGKPPLDDARQYWQGQSAIRQQIIQLAVFLLRKLLQAYIILPECFST
eukprot:4890530-Amphidinium_carterae.1